MTSANAFTNARIGFGGHLSGWDDEPDDLFEILRIEAPILFGDYFTVAMDAYDFNIEIGPFGHVSGLDVGNLDARQDFSMEECVAAEQMIRTFFSTLIYSRNLFAVREVSRRRSFPNRVDH